MKYILSISGGGIRGIIPAIILAELERRIERPIAECFDLIAGTSSGGLICGLLTTPNSKNKPKYTAAQIVELYKQFGQKVFKSNCIRSFFTANGLIATKYSYKPLEKLLKNYFMNTHLSDCLTSVIIPAYQISNRPYPYFFKTKNCRKNSPKVENPYMWECVRATTAANGYFKPYKMDYNHTFLDGGVFANTPAMCAYAQAKSDYGEKEKIFILSIESGENLIGYNYNTIKNWGMLQWALPFFRQTSISASDTVDYMLRALTHTSDKYYHLQSKLSEDSIKMDDASPENIKRLEKVAKNTIKNNERTINDIARYFI